MTRWTRTEIETLISLYESNTFLYDSKHGDYHNRTKRDHMLQEIADRINEIRGNQLTLADIKGKIKTLRTQYGAEKQHMLDRYRNTTTFDTTGEPLTVSKVGEPKLWCYENLKFLDDYTKERMETLSFIDEKPKRITIRSPKPTQSYPDKWNPLDKEDIFANFVAVELREITDSRLLHDTKWKIQLALKEGIEKQMEYNSESLITEVII